MSTPSRRDLVALLSLAAFGACDGAVEAPPASDTLDAPDATSSDATPPDVSLADAPWHEGFVLPRAPQDQGDPVAGRTLLLNGGYMSCGFPWSLWQNALVGSALQRAFGVAEDPPLADGRDGDNAALPYSVNKFAAADGTEVVNRNCLGCHAGRFDGELVVGLGNATADFTADTSAVTSVPASTFDALGLTPPERAQLDRMLRGASAVGTRLRTRTIGQNPAEELTAALLAHHDPETLAWSEEPLVTAVRPTHDPNHPDEDVLLISDPPPWWRAHKKNALFYNGMARGQHRGTMALASSMCVDDVAEARRIDAMFLDMHAYVLTLRPPAYKRPIDRALAARGEPIYVATCSGCHGTYAADPRDDAGDWYPNLILPLDVIGTDPAVAHAASDNPEMVAAYNASFYGSVAPAVPSEPTIGYVAPPLDGIWATAPFLHNGSVPTIALVLDSTARPRVWKRVDLDDTHFDEDALGWPYVALDRPQAEAPAAERKHIYDTTYYSQSNAGHTFGDDLTPDERRAVLEYLKTL